MSKLRPQAATAHLRSRLFELTKIRKHAISVDPEITHTVSPRSEAPYQMAYRAFPPKMTLAEHNSPGASLPNLRIALTLTHYQLSHAAFFGQP